jgi:Gas vesicle synthesis protein GvpL/GvpF
VIWVYAVCEHPELRLPPVRGLDQAPLEGIADGPMLAVVSRHRRIAGDPALEAMWAHERVVEALMAERAVLPMQFGTRLPDPDAVREALASRRDVLMAALERVRGRVELAVRAIGPPADPEPPAASGAEYLRARLRSEASVAALHEPLAALAVATRRWPERAPNEVLHASYLVEQREVPRFRGAVEQLQREHSDAALLCTGPWPPYSFMERAGK